jgi:signal transduction histidine kinase
VRPGTVPGDRDALARAVRNLLENAERHAVTRVEVALRPMDGHIRMTVSDDGPGIPLEERDRVFERFTRLDESRARDDGGAGLGLAIVREIVATHGGRIDIADGGSGACFVVDLPAAGTPDAPRD